MYDTVQSGICVPMFRRNILIPSSGCEAARHSINLRLLTDACQFMRHSLCFQVQNSPVCGDFKHFCLFSAKLKLHQIIAMIYNTKLAKLAHFFASTYIYIFFFWHETQCAHFAFYYVEFHAGVVLCLITFWHRPLYRTGVSLLYRERFLYIQSTDIFHYLIFA